MRNDSWYLAAGALALAMTFAGAPALRAQDLSYDMATTATMIDPRTNAATDSHMFVAHGQFAGGVSRLDITESMARGGLMGAGTYTITSADEMTTTIVDPAKREYSVLDRAALLKTSQDLQQSMGSLGASMQISGINVAVEDLGAGEPMDGYATHKFRLTESYTMTMHIAGQTKPTPSRSVTDVWMAPQLNPIMDPRARPTAAVTGPMAELSRQLAAAYAKFGKGLMLKRVTTDDSGDGDRKHSTTMTMIISNVRHASISPSVFQVPAGYTKVESLSDAMSPMGAMQDSIAAARARSARKHGSSGMASTAGDVVDSAGAGAQQGAVDGAKEGANAKAKKVMGKLFGRLP